MTFSASDSESRDRQGVSTASGPPGSVRVESRRPGRFAGTEAKNSKNHPLPIRKFPNSLPG